jgi:hypothetical protein
MNRVPRSLTTSVMTVALLLVACTPATEAPASATPSAGGSIAGRYDCQQPGASETDLVELREDGTVTITQGESAVQGTWSVDGDSGAFTVEGQDDPFTVEEDRLVFEDGTVCTKGR